MARKIMIATHGRLADGFKSALGIFTHEADNIATVDAYVEGEPEDYTPAIKAFVESVGPDDEGVIFTDLLGGSVNQKVIQTVGHNRGNLHVVTGSNLICILGTLLEERPLTREVMEELISAARVEYVELPETYSKEVDSEEDFLN